MKSQVDERNVEVKAFVLEDHKEVAALHRSIFPETPSAKLGARYCHELYRAYATEPDAFGFVLWRGTERVGFVVGGTNNIHEIISRKIRLTAGISLLFHPRLLIKYLGTLRSQAAAKRKNVSARAVSAASSAEKTSGTEGKASKLFLIGISKEARGTGGAALLMNSFMTQAFQRGFAKVLLIVHRDNSRARAAYEKSGWVLNDKGGEAVEYYITASSIANVN